MRVKVGCCGFPTSRKRYFREFGLVEIQRTFYRIPRASTVERWRKESPKDFEYTLKAWAAITHRPGGPVWRKAGIDCADCGMLRPTEGNFTAWEMVRVVAAKLGSKIVIFQSPPSFRRSDLTERDLRDFFSSLDRGGLAVGWEPRDESWWIDERGLIRLLDDLDLIHVVDPFYRRPLDGSDLAYFRLHGGRKDGKILYKYSYSTQEFQDLLGKLEKMNKKEAYVLFNNMDMWNNALEFRKMVLDRQLI